MLDVLKMLGGEEELCLGRDVGMAVGCPAEVGSVSHGQGAVGAGDKQGSGA